MTERDDELHDARLSALYRRRGDEQPSGRLDAAIRKAARRAAAGPPAVAGRRRLWPSLASAAVLVLGVAVALKVFEGPEPSPPPPASGPVEPDSAGRRTAEEARPGPRESAPAPAPASPGEALKGSEPKQAGAGRGERLSPQDGPPVSGAAPERRRARLLGPDAMQDRTLAEDCADAEALQELETEVLRERLEAARRAGDQAEVGCLQELLGRRSDPAEGRVE